MTFGTAANRSFLSLILLQLLLGMLFSMPVSHLQAENQICFEAISINYPSREKNTQIYLEIYEERLITESQYEFQIGKVLAEISLYEEEGHKEIIREKRKRNIWFSKRIKGNVDTMEFNFKLPAGKYRIGIEVIDEYGKKHYFQELAYEVADPDMSNTLADIVLYHDIGSASRDLYPLISNTLMADISRIVFSSEAFLEPNQPYQGRAVLLKKKDKTGLLNAQHYTSIYLVNRRWNTDSSMVEFRGEFPIRDLDPGEYLLEVYLYNKNKLVAQESKSFIKKWDKYYLIFGDPDKYIERMSLIADQGLIYSLLAIENNEDKGQALEKFWMNRYPESETQAWIHMEKYYQKVDLVEQKMSVFGDTWDSDRGKTYFHYGAPDEVAEEEIGNIFYEIWYYRQWAMKFIFKKQDQTFLLIQPRRVTP